MKYAVKSGSWQDEFESFIYFYIVDERNKKVWDGMWMDTRDLTQKYMMDLFRDNLNRGCRTYGLTEIPGENKNIFEWQNIANKEREI